MTPMFRFLTTEKYRSVSETEDVEELLPSTDNFQIPPTHPPQRQSTYLIAAFLVITLFIFFTVGFCIGRNFPIYLDKTCTRLISKYSPVLDDMDISYHLEDFDGRFEEENIYRQVGSPEVDAAWEALGVGYRHILLPKSRAQEAGLTTDHAHARGKYGGGYPVFMEGMHQLHCLNLVRQSLYYNHDYYQAQGKEAFGDRSDELHWHVSHCLDVLRQRLMCTMDTDVFGSIWVGNRTAPRPFVDFNTKHVCKNFDGIREWAEKNQMPASGPEDFYELPSNETKIWRWAP